MKKQNFFLFFSCVNLIAVCAVGASNMLVFGKFELPLENMFVMLYLYAHVGMYIYLISVYYWVLASFFYAWKYWTDKFWLAFLINVFVLLLGWQFCSIFPMCIKV